MTTAVDSSSDDHAVTVGSNSSETSDKSFVAAALFTVEQQSPWPEFISTSDAPATELQAGQMIEIGPVYSHDRCEKCEKVRLHKVAKRYTGFQ